MADIGEVGLTFESAETIQTVEPRRWLDVLKDEAPEMTALYIKRSPQNFTDGVAA